MEDKGYFSLVCYVDYSECCVWAGKSLRVVSNCFGNT